MSEAFDHASRSVGEESLALMALTSGELLPDLRKFQVAREGPLDNGAMAAQGFPGNTTWEINKTGRLNGYLREFVSPIHPALLQDGSDLIVASVVHLFEEPEQVSQWMEKKFLGEFKSFVGRELSEDQILVRAQQIEVEGYSDKAVGLHSLQTTDAGLVSSTVVDFRVGRVLGVAYVVSLGDVERKQLATQVGLILERRVVKVLLGSGRVL